MVRRFSGALVVFAFLFAAFGPVKSANADETDSGFVNIADDETASSWFVELTTAPTSEGTSVATTEASKDSFRSAAKSSRPHRAPDRWRACQPWQDVRPRTLPHNGLRICQA